MILDHFMFFGNLSAIRRYLPVVLSTVEFFAQHFNNRTAEGKMVIFPTQVLETFWCHGWGWKPNKTTGQNMSNLQWDDCVANDLPTVAALHALTSRLLLLPEELLEPAKRQQYAELRQILPPIPLANGTLVPAEHFVPTPHNDETPTLYAVHPFRLMTVGSHIARGVNLSAARNARALSHCQGGSTGSLGWSQCPMDFALLGEIELAWADVRARAHTRPAIGYRFDAFAPHEQDYVPSSDHYANMASALQSMLLQPGDDGFANATTWLRNRWLVHCTKKQLILLCDYAIMQKKSRIYNIFRNPGDHRAASGVALQLGRQLQAGGAGHHRCRAGVQRRRQEGGVAHGDPPQQKRQGRVCWVRGRDASKAVSDPTATRRRRRHVTRGGGGGGGGGT